MSFADDDIVSNPSDNTTFSDVLETSLARRTVLAGGLATAAATFLTGSALGAAGSVMAPDEAEAAPGDSLLGFSAVALSTADELVVPDGYRADVVLRWGDPLFVGQAGLPADVSHTASDQARQFGMHCDGMHLFESPGIRGLGALASLVVNHEYTDDGLLHPDGFATWTAEKVAKAQAAHGVSVVAISQRRDQSWRPVASRLNRRITASSEIDLSGPAAGHALLQTAADPAGDRVLGTVNNCAHGHTPWGTYLACEENFNGYFVNRGVIPALQARYGISATGAGYRWHEFDTRFDAGAHPNEPNRFGWVTEIDPERPGVRARKRTALGRFKHEGAWVTTTKAGVPVVYMGDDERFEYIYKFVGAEPWLRSRLSGRDPLDRGTLYVARFDADGSGQWLPLVAGGGPLTAAHGFPDQATVLINARGAADALGATKMDRPEWIAVHPGNRDVYCTLTNNSQRADPGKPAVDAANPRPKNTFGHIIRWTEAGRHPAATSFQWDIFVLAGDSTNVDPNKQGNINGDDFGSPDGLWFGYDRRLWIQTDVSTSTLNAGDYANLGNNQMLCADVATGEIRRFLVGPKGCEVTGVITTRDRRTMFVGIQHPGEPASERNNPASPKAISSWPDGDSFTRPRSSVIAVRKLDGGVIGGSAPLLTSS